MHTLYNISSKKLGSVVCGSFVLEDCVVVQPMSVDILISWPMSVAAYAVPVVYYNRLSSSISVGYPAGTES